MSPSNRMRPLVLPCRGHFLLPDPVSLMQADLDHPIEAVGKNLRGRMDWLTE